MKRNRNRIMLDLEEEYQLVIRLEGVRRRLTPSKVIVSLLEEYMEDKCREARRIISERQSNSGDGK